MSSITAPFLAVKSTYSLVYSFTKPIPPDSMNEKDSDTGPEGEEDADDKELTTKVRTPA